MHGTTFRAPRVTSQVATPGAESAVYDDCLVSTVLTTINRVHNPRLDKTALYTHPVFKKPPLHHKW